MVLMASVLFVFAECHAENKAQHDCFCLLAFFDHSSPANSYAFNPPHSFIDLKIADDTYPLQSYGLDIEYPPWLNSV